MDTRFTKVIREAVDSWTKTFNPVGLSEKIDRMFRQQVDEEVQRLTSELNSRATQAEASAKREREKNSVYETRIAELESTLAQIKAAAQERDRFQTARFQDLEGRYSAVIRSAQVAR